MTPGTTPGIPDMVPDGIPVTDMAPSGEETTGVQPLPALHAPTLPAVMFRLSPVADPARQPL